MQIYLIDTPVTTQQEAGNRPILRRAVVVSISEDGALNVLLRAIQGAEVFSGFKDADRFNRPDDQPYFNQDTCEIVELGNCSRPGTSRVVAWELLPPESEEDGNDFPETQE